MPRFSDQDPEAAQELTRDKQEGLSPASAPGGSGPESVAVALTLPPRETVAGNCWPPRLLLPCPCAVSLLRGAHLF